MTELTHDTASLTALLDSDPPAGVLAVADLRERRAKAATPGPYRVQGHAQLEEGCRCLSCYGDSWSWEIAQIDGPECKDTGDYHVMHLGHADAEHIAAEANPAHALAAVRRWRGFVRRHAAALMWDETACKWCANAAFPCPDLRETADEARAYLGVLA